MFKKGQFRPTLLYIPITADSAKLTDWLSRKAEETSENNRRGEGVGVGGRKAIAKT